jgi:hypothetical protein
MASWVISRSLGHDFINLLEPASALVAGGRRASSGGDLKWLACLGTFQGGRVAAGPNVLGLLRFTLGWIMKSRALRGKIP